MFGPQSPLPACREIRGGWDCGAHGKSGKKARLPRPAPWPFAWAGGGKLANAQRSLCNSGIFGMLDDDALKPDSPKGVKSGMQKQQELGARETCAALLERLSEAVSG